MSSLPFTFADIESECAIETGHYELDGRSLGMRVTVPEGLMQQAPYTSSAYDFLQQLRPQILAYGLLEFPNLPLNPQNHTLAQRAPQQHAYSTNHYMTDYCQSPHQDTPPYPTAFWLNAPRQYFATWVMSESGLEKFYRRGQGLAESKLTALHRELVPASLAEGWGLLLNQQPGLLLIDNSHHQSLYHARTCNFAAQDAQPDFYQDSPMYAFNEVGLLNYIDKLDSRRGQAHRNREEVLRVRQFMQRENLAGRAWSLHKGAVCRAEDKA